MLTISLASLFARQSARLSSEASSHSWFAALRSSVIFALAVSYSEVVISTAMAPVANVQPTATAMIFSLNVFTIRPRNDLRFMRGSVRTGRLAAAPGAGTRCQGCSVPGLLGADAGILDAGGEVVRLLAH
jgi:hypothetical protein